MNDARLQPAHGPGKMGDIREGGAGHFQRNPSGERQGAGHGQQNPSRAEIQSGGEFEEFLAPLIAAADKYRNRQG